MAKKIKLVIFDIDGCLADDVHRRHLLPKHTNGAEKDGHAVHEEFDAYHSQAPHDVPLKIGKAVFEQVIKSLSDELDFCDKKIVFFTARPERYRRATMAWLKYFLDFEWNAPTFSEGLYMRPETDRDPSPVTKYKMLVSAITHYHTRGYDVEVVAAYDDRKDVLAMYAANNIQANYLGTEGAYEFEGKQRVGKIYLTPFRDGSVKASPYQGSAPFGHNVVPAEKPAPPPAQPEGSDFAKIYTALFPNGIGAASHRQYDLFHALTGKVEETVACARKLRASLKRKA